jgi:hypothetical protein
VVATAAVSSSDDYESCDDEGFDDTDLLALVGELR